MKTGTIDRIGSNGLFGFIRPDDGSDDVHFSIRKSSPDTLKTVGARVEFDSVPRPQGPHTDNPRITDQAATPAAATTPVISASPPTVVHKTEPELEPFWEFGQIRQTENLKQVATCIRFLKAGSPAPGVSVSLHKVDRDGTDVQVLSPRLATTDGEGKVHFEVFFEAGTESLMLTAKVGRDHYSQRWPKFEVERVKPATTEPATPTVDSAKPLEADDIEISVPINPRPDGTFLLRVITIADGKKIPARFLILPPRICNFTPVVGANVEISPDLSRIRIRGTDDNQVELSIGWTHIWFEMQSGEHGVMETLVAFEGKQISIELRCGNIVKIVDLVKPRHLMRAANRQEQSHV